MQSELTKKLARTMLPFAAAGIFAAESGYDSGVANSVMAKMANTAARVLDLSAAKAEAVAPSLKTVAVMPELAGLSLKNPGLKQAMDALTKEHVPGNPAATAKAAMWQLYQLSEANKGDWTVQYMMDSLMFLATARYLETTHWTKYNQVGIANKGTPEEVEILLPYDMVDIGDIPPIFIKETKRGRLVRRQGRYPTPPGYRPNAITGEQWGIEYNRDNARTYNVVWEEYIGKTYNSAAAAYYLDSLDYLLHDRTTKPMKDMTEWNAIKGNEVPFMVSDIAGSGHVPAPKVVPVSTNPYTVWNEHKKTAQIKSVDDLVKFAENNFIFLKPPPADANKYRKTFTVQNLWNTFYGDERRTPRYNLFTDHLGISNTGFSINDALRHSKPNKLWGVDAGVGTSGPLVKRFYQDKVNQLRDYLPKFDAMGKDITGKPIVINGAGKKTSAIPYMPRKYRG
ncbi:hypothetical protein FACS1894186_0170 [Alphaproteobacteria bacterium]|nr:hypothetical protein FACS1894186_0170 [Alphaproteobacteria bacterium]